MMQRVHILFAVIKIDSEVWHTHRFSECACIQMASLSCGYFFEALVPIIMECVWRIRHTPYLPNIFGTRSLVFPLSSLSSLLAGTTAILYLDPSCKETFLCPSITSFYLRAPQFHVFFVAVSATVATDNPFKSLLCLHSLSWNTPLVLPLQVLLSFNLSRSVLQDLSWLELTRFALHLLKFCEVHPNSTPTRELCVSNEPAIPLSGCLNLFNFVFI